MGKPQIKVLKADITSCDVEALVNPANSLMRMGGGVAWALKRAAGSVVEEEALKHAPVPVGSAIATSAGRLKSKYIIHAPTMEKPAIKTTKTKVYLATLAALRVAEYLNVRTIAFPAMGAGVGSVPIEESTKAMINAIREYLSRATTCLKEIILVGLNDETVANFNRALEITDLTK